MRRVYLEDLQPGMIIARTIIGRDGRSLLTENTRLTENYISKLDTLGITSIYIKDGLADNEIPEIISQKVLAQVSNSLTLSIKNLTTRNVLQIDSLKKGVSLLIEDIMSNQHLLIQLEDIHSSDDYLFFHSINVAVFSIMVGITLGYPENRLMDMGLGALVHDIGMTMIDPGIVKKQGPLDPRELEQLKGHTEIGFNILRTYREVSTMSAHIAYQHHERISGTGYPRQLEGRQIIEFAKIVAVADTFDALISDRPYRKGYSSAEAVTVLNK
ncbi:MAG: HD domain-containing phosphohydrolase, partial [Syntrophomonadaceae bacterium]